MTRVPRSGPRSTRAWPPSWAIVQIPREAFAFAELGGGPFALDHALAVSLEEAPGGVRADHPGTPAGRSPVGGQADRLLAQTDEPGKRQCVGGTGRASAV